MATVGKKKYKKIYVTRRRRGGSMLPLLIGGGIVAYFLFFNKAAASSTVQTTTPPPPGGLSSNPNPVLVDDGTGTGTLTIQPHPVIIVPGENLPAVNTIAANDRQALLRDAAAYPLVIAALKLMTSQELVDTYNYYYNFYQNGKTLYRYPDAAHPGDWNTGLYDAIQVIRAKYHIF